LHGHLGRRQATDRQPVQWGWGRLLAGIPSLIAGGFAASLLASCAIGVAPATDSQSVDPPTGSAAAMDPVAVRGQVESPTTDCAPPAFRGYQLISGKSSDWTRLPLATNGKIDAIAIAADWQDGGPIVVARGSSPGSLVRSWDGGASWEGLPPPPFNVHDELMQHFAFAPPASSRLLFALVGGRFDWGIYRSTDAGVTWEAGPTEKKPAESAAGPFQTPRTEVQVRLSPNFECDGQLFISGGSQLYGSRDRGLTWGPVVVPEGQYVQDLAFSPGFARDATIFAGAVSDQLTQAEPHLGMLMSRDGGQTWTRRSAGLEVEGVPYRYVHHLAVSPSYATDQTLYAVSAGPGTSPCYRDFHGQTVAIFRSTDGAGSWQWVQTLGSACVHRLRLHLHAPGSLQIVDSVSGFSPSASTCITATSGDAGRTWRRSNSGSYQGCSRISLWGDERGMMAGTPPTTHLGPGTPPLAVVRSADDDLILFGAIDQLWKYGPVDPPDPDQP
jgi:hypothetical protein